MKRRASLFLLLTTTLCFGQFNFSVQEFYCQNPGTTGGTPTEWLTVTNPPSPRNDGPYTVGCKFTVGGGNIIVTHVGRYVYSGNSHTHKISIYDSGCSLVSTANLNTSGLGVGLQYVALPSPVVLSAGQAYYIVSLEDGVDDWGNSWSGWTATGVAGSVRAFYGSGDICPDNAYNTGEMFVGLSFKY